MQRGHAENLAPMVERVMRGAGMEFRSLTRIAVTTGPGTFTGQRVGLAFARALGVALHVPVAGVTTLEAMTEEALSMNPGARWAIAVADAKRAEAYLAASAANRTMLISPQLLPLAGIGAALATLLPGYGLAPLIAGTATTAVAAELEAHGLRVSDSGIRQPNAIFVAQLAARMQKVEAAQALYLRKPDAKLPQKNP